jgi:hypothetical protein
MPIGMRGAWTRWWRTGGATSLRAIAGELNGRGMLTRRGGRWHVFTVTNLLERLGMREPACASLG